MDKGFSSDEDSKDSEVKRLKKRLRRWEETTVSLIENSDSVHLCSVCKCPYIEGMPEVEQDWCGRCIK